MLPGRQAQPDCCILDPMLASRNNPPRRPPHDAFFAVKPRKTVPHEFVLEALERLSPRTNPMFGCLAVYVGPKIVLILRDKPTQTADNGVWLATTPEHHESLRREFPHMRSIGVLGEEMPGWQILAAERSEKP